MRKILFIMSHLESGSDILYNSLNFHQQVQGVKFLNTVYDNSLSIFYVTNRKHKLNNSSAIFMDELLYNYQFQTKAAYNFGKFIFILREAESALNLLVEKGYFPPLQAQRYYLYRLRRMCEMAKRVPGALVLNAYDIKHKKGSEVIADYLGLTTKFTYEDYEFVEPKRLGLLPSHLVEEAEVAFEKYWYFLRSQNLIFNSTTGASSINQRTP